MHGLLSDVKLLLSELLWIVVSWRSALRNLRGCESAQRADCWGRDEAPGWSSGHEIACVAMCLDSACVNAMQHRNLATAGSCCSAGQCASDDKEGARAGGNVESGLRSIMIPCADVGTD